MSEIKNLQPKLVWEIFDEITKVPRPSKHEEKIGQYLVDFAKKHHLEYQCDAIGNVVIRKSATAGYENRPTVVLQAHTDMVCEKNSDKVFDFNNDAIQTFIDGDWVKADGTTLGADDGIGMAAALALLVDETLAHPAIEALFTVDEETGLTGAFNLGEGMVQGKYLINLDSEDEGEVFIGCAGGVDTLAYMPLVTEKAPADFEYYKVTVSGLLGGHSGDDIDKGHANSNKWAARIAERATRLFGARLSHFDGGNLRNAIPREAYIVLGVPSDNATAFENDVEAFGKALCAEFAIVEKGAKVECIKTTTPATVLAEATQRNLLLALMSVPSGVLAMSAAMPGLVETSTNLASVKFRDDEIVITTSQRSSVESAKEYAKLHVESVFLAVGCEVVHSDGYPGWAPNPSSTLLECTKEAYRKLFGTEPKVRAIHAGLECGLFLEKYPHLEMVSFGPTLRGVHSPDERLEIATVDKFWKLLVEVVGTIK
ncbi:MAG: aminoacyl-histidine dipeptidase [Alistipes sp.]|nr:aminoacyl-histidine dipeptidase [Alistipes sp.]